MKIVLAWLVLTVSNGMATDQVKLGLYNPEQCPSIAVEAVINARLRGINLEATCEYAGRET